MARGPGPADEAEHDEEALETGIDRVLHGTRVTPETAVAGRKHGGVDWPTKSQFSISKEELAVLLQSERVVRAPAVRVVSGNFIREVDVGRVIGNLAIKRGGEPTSILTVFTDAFGNLVNTFPGKRDYR